MALYHEVIAPAPAYQYRQMCHGTTDYATVRACTPYNTYMFFICVGVRAMDVEFYCVRNVGVTCTIKEIVIISYSPGVFFVQALKERHVCRVRFAIIANNRG